MLLEARKLFKKDWYKIAEHVGTRDANACYTKYLRDKRNNKIVEDPEDLSDTSDDNHAVHLGEAHAPQTQWRWTEAETKLLLEAVTTHGKDWYKVSQHVKSRNPLACETKFKSHQRKEAKNNGEVEAGTQQWTKQEHKLLLEAIKLYGKDWEKISRHVKSRTPKACRGKFLRDQEKINKGDKKASKPEKSNSRNTKARKRALKELEDEEEDEDLCMSDHSTAYSTQNSTDSDGDPVPKRRKIATRSTTRISTKLNSPKHVDVVEDLVSKQASEDCNSTPVIRQDRNGNAKRVLRKPKFQTTKIVVTTTELSEEQNIAFLLLDLERECTINSPSSTHSSAHDDCGTSYDGDSSEHSPVPQYSDLFLSLERLPVYLPSAT